MSTKVALVHNGSNTRAELNGVKRCSVYALGKPRREM